ncbi:MAG: putative S-layer protein, partial [Nanoarchaeota archaeon]|nr:putative S-layer protein [Nanoarchaeota archaeon]
MIQKSYAFLGILTVLLMSLGVVSANVSENNVTITLNQTSISNVSEGEVYSIVATIENLNDTTFYVSFRQTNWDSWTGGKNVVNGTSGEFVGTFTIPESLGSRGVYADIYNASNNSQKLFSVDKSISLTYYNETNETSEIEGCTDSNANNYNPNATEDDGSCTYPTTSDYKYCDDFNGEKGHLEITSFEIDNYGKGDDDEWEYLDNIIIEVAVENTGDDNINDVLVELMIKDEDDNEISRRKINLDDDEIDLGRIKDDDEEIAVFKIDEVPIDLDEGTYRIYVRAYDEKNEDLECTSVSEDFNNDDETYFEFDITSSEDATVIVKDDLDNILASCGDKNVEVKFMVYNIGDDDEEKVLVTLENSKLGIYEKKVIDNLRDKKGKEVVFFITIPEELEKSTYELDIYTYYDYDEDEDELDELVAYGESSEEEGDDFSVLLEILSCREPAPSISASLDSDAKVGEELIITVSVTNNGDDNNFIISASGFENWAELVSIEPQSPSIDEDDTATVLIKLIPTKGGFQTLKVNTVVDGENYDQAVSVNIEEEESFFANIDD